jgi:hypothetical protein
MVFGKKEEESAKWDEMRCWEKEEQMQRFANIQRKTLEVQKRRLNSLRIKIGQGPRDLSSKQKRMRPQYCLPRRARS